MHNISKLYFSPKLFQLTCGTSDRSIDAGYMYKTKRIIGFAEEKKEDSEDEDRHTGLKKIVVTFDSSADIFNCPIAN